MSYQPISNYIHMTIEYKQWHDIRTLCVAMRSEWSCHVYFGLRTSDFVIFYIADFVFYSLHVSNTGGLRLNTGWYPPHFPKPTVLYTDVFSKRPQSTIFSRQITVATLMYFIFRYLQTDSNPVSISY